MSDVGPVGSTIAAASQSLRDTSKWLVGGVVATAAGVFAGASLTSFGSLNPSTDTLRFGLAIYGLVFGFVALAFILRAATKVLTLESISLDELLSSNNPELIDLKTILNQRYKHLLPQGTNTLGEYSGAVDAVSRKEEKTDNDQAYLDRAARDKALITADARF